jgi:hypothetical protein
VVVEVEVEERLREAERRADSATWVGETLGGGLVELDWIHWLHRRMDGWAIVLPRP